MARSLKINFAYQAAWQILLILTPLITTPYLARVLGTSAIGSYSFAFSVATYFGMVATLGMSTHGVRVIAACGDDRQRRSRVFWSTYASQLLMGTLTTALYIVYMLFFSAVDFRITAAWGFYVIAAVLDITWLLFGVEEFKIPTIRSIITKLASIIAIFVFVHTPDDAWIYALAIALSFFVNQILIWPFVKRYVDFAKPQKDEFVKQFKGSAGLFIPVIAINLYTTLARILLGAMTDMSQVGFFDYADKLSRMPLAVVTAVGTVMLPRMASKLASGKRDEAVALLEDSLWSMLAMALALAFGIAAIAPEFAPVFLGEKFARCDSLMAILAISIPLISFSNVLGRQYLVPTQRDRLYTISVFIGAAVSIVLSIVLIPHLLAMGTVISSVAAELTVLLVQALFTRKELPLLRYVRNAIPFVAAGAIMFAIVRFAAAAFNAVWGISIIGLILEILVGIVAFALIALVWCFVSKDPHFKRVFGQVAQRLGKRK